jgi:enoyl-CoA hydratase
MAADEAGRVGLADRVVPAGKALDAAKALAREISAFPPLAMAADRAAAWAAFDGGEAARLIEEERGAQAAKAQEAAIGAARFKVGEGRGGAVPEKAPKSEG